MTSIELTSIVGVLPPYIVYACDIYGASCIPIATISTGVPPPNVIILPPAFAYAPAVGIKISGETCSRFEVFFCDELFPQHVCLIVKIQVGLTFSYYFNFTIDENINGKPSYIGDYLGTSQTLYWDGSQWIISPLGLTNPNEGLFFGTWFSLGGSSYILSNSYCPSICILLFDGVNTTHYFLQFTTVLLAPPSTITLKWYLYDDGIITVQVIYNIFTNQWELEINSVLIATLPILTDDDTPIGTWVLEPSVPYVGIITVLECPDDFKQFQNTEYFYFMDGIQYNFQT
jgi:hypothetical protein